MGLCRACDSTRICRDACFFKTVLGDLRPALNEGTMSTLDVILITVATVIALLIIGSGVGFWLFDKPRYDPTDP